MYDILRGKFLVNKDAMKNWRFILFCTSLAIIMIAFSHSSERKVHQLGRMSKEVRRLRSEFVDSRKRLMQLKMESTVSKRLEGTGIGPSTEPPKKIIIKNTKS